MIIGLDFKFDIKVSYSDIIDELVSNKLITASRHPELPLRILKYTPTVQYDRLWKEYPFLLRCRALVVDDEGMIISPGLRKFFNLEEYESPFTLPSENYKVFAKYDGSLVSCFMYHNRLVLTSCGSFTSPQVNMAREIIDEYGYYNDLCRICDYDKVLFFELIHPDNRIIVDYGDRKELILTAAVDSVFDIDLDIDNIDFPNKAEEFNWDFSEVCQADYNNDEGYVIRWEDGFRIKVKHPEYIEKHKFLSNFTTNTILDFASTHRTKEEFDSFIKDIPDEAYQFFKDEYARLTYEYDKIRIKAVEFYCSYCMYCKTRKDLSYQAEKFEYPNLIFAIEDGKPLSDMIWKIVRKTTEINRFCKEV